MLTTADTNLKIGSLLRGSGPTVRRSALRAGDLQRRAGSRLPLDCRAPRPRRVHRRHSFPETQDYVRKSSTAEDYRYLYGGVSETLTVNAPAPNPARSASPSTASAKPANRRNRRRRRAEDEKGGVGVPAFARSPLRSCPQRCHRGTEVRAAFARCARRQGTARDHGGRRRGPVESSSSRGSLTLWPSQWPAETFVSFVSFVLNRLTMSKLTDRRRPLSSPSRSSAMTRLNHLYGGVNLCRVSGLSGARRRQGCGLRRHQRRRESACRHPGRAPAARAVAHDFARRYGLRSWPTSRSPSAAARLKR